MLKEMKEMLADVCASVLDAGGRSDLADKEQADMVVIESYLPAQLSAADLEGVVDAAIAEAGATSQKQMGQVIKLVQAKTAGAADNREVSALVKAKLSSGK
jgi:uncharacterized protein YqeY